MQGFLQQPCWLQAFLDAGCKRGLLHFVIGKKKKHKNIGIFIIEKDGKYVKIVFRSA